VDENGGRRRPYAPLSGDERALFLKVLRETGNRRAAAAAIGVEPRLMDQRRAHDPALDRDWRAAVDEAHFGLALAKGPFDCPRGKALNTIRRGRNGRLQLVAAGEGTVRGQLRNCPLTVPCVPARGGGAGRVQAAGDARLLLA
jgi:hypothetical protein